MRTAARWIPVILYAAGIFCLSSLPETPAYPVPLPGADKVLHFLLYFFFAALLYRALGGPKEKRSRAAFLAAAAAAAYGLTDEIHQAFVRGRTASLWDWLADAAGAFAFLAVLFAARKTRATRPDRSEGP